MKRLWPFVFGRRREELQQELESHLRMAVADRVARGESAAVARQEALREFGNLPLIQDVTRRMWAFGWLEHLAQDVHYAWRQIRRSPTFAATVVGMLALGIGASAAMFTVVDHELLQPVSYRNPDRLVAILEGAGKEARGPYLAPWLDIQEWRNRSHSFQQIAFWDDYGDRNYLGLKTSALTIRVVAASPNLFLTLGINPVLGRGFLPASANTGSGADSGTVVLSYSLWRTVFDSDPGISGRAVTINDTPYTVVGVMPRGFAFPRGDSSAEQVWVRAELGKVDQTRSIDAWHFEAIGRLRKGQTVQSAQEEMKAIQASIAPEYTNPRSRAEHSTVSVQRYDETLVSSRMREALWALLGASAVLWLIASFNATNLFLARGTVRQREIAMRGALGASRWRVTQQMIVESLAFSSAAAVLGIGAAAASLKMLTHAMSSQLPIPVPATPDLAILLALLALTGLSALVSGVWPTLLAVRTPIEPILKQNGMQTGTGRRQHRMRAALVTLEVALSLTLLVACGLLLRTIYTLRHVPLGFRTHHIIVANLDLPSFRFSGQNMTQVLYQPLLERVKRLPGTEAAGLITEVPLGNTFAPKLTLRIFGNAAPTYFKAVSPSIRNVFGLRMAAGRFFDPEDTPTTPTAAVVNEAFARLYSPDSHNPAEIVGRKLFNSNRDSTNNVGITIVGVLRDERQQEVEDPAQPEIDICIPQITPANMFWYHSMEQVAMDLAVRTDQPPAVVIPELREVLRQASPELGTATITTMDQIVADSYGNERTAAHLLEIFGGSALLLCIAGLYGLLSYVVAQRTREIGVRIALGAARENLVWLVLREAGVMLAIGVVAGSILALAVSRLVRGYLYGVSSHDSLTLAGSAAILFLAGMLAAFLPARRAARVNPVDALRAE